MNMLKPLLLLALLLAGFQPAAAASRKSGLDHWLAYDATPFVIERLASHPRFAGESLRFVVLENGKPLALSNALALRIRDRLREAAADVPGVRLAWQPDDPHQLDNAGPGGLDCTRGEVHYLVGVETFLVEPGALAVAVRALDLEDGTVVADFERRWTGSLNAREYREFRHIATDPTFRGARDVPYDTSQVDLLAAHLAHDLGCNLLRQTAAEYVITASGAATQPAPVRGMVELVSNNLAQVSSLQFTAAADSANAVIEGKAHRIDEDLYQYWVTVHARDTAADLKPLSASAYVRLPEQFAVAEAYQAPPLNVAPAAAGVLSSLKIVTMPGMAACRTAAGGTHASGRVRTWGEPDPECFALQVRTTGDAVVFFLHHQLNNGLVRLADGTCPRQASARIARTGRSLEFALPPESLASASWSPGGAWQLQPDLDTYYAVAATDTQAGRALSRHLERLPQRCTASVRPGLEGYALQRWMEEMNTIIKRWSPAIGWQTIRVKNIY